jgi:polysaccharide export outer membrane protein
MDITTVATMEKQMRKLLISFTIFTALALSCVAQTAESLLIGPGDFIDIKIFDTPEMAQKVRVTDAGTVRLELIGELKLAGETPISAAKVVERALIDTNMMRNPQVTVTVEEYATLDVSVLGQVKNPGNYPIATPQSVLKVLTLAGGLTDIADRNVTIQRHHDISQEIKYYVANNADQALSNSVVVYPGDIVVVPKAAVVWVMGDVAKPGGYAIATNDSRLTVLQAIAMAGSANKTAMQSHVKLIRKTLQGQQELPIQLSAIQKGKQPDLILQPDDVLYVPFSWMKNTAVSAASIAASTSSAAIYTVR